MFWGCFLFFSFFSSFFYNTNSSDSVEHFFTNTNGLASIEHFFTNTNGLASVQHFFTNMKDGLASVEHVALESCTFGKHTQQFCIFYMAPIDLPEDSVPIKHHQIFRAGDDYRLQCFLS